MLTPLAQLITYGFLIAAVLFLVFVGSRLYQKINIQKTANEDLRSTVIYLQNQISANDTGRGVQVQKGPETDALVFPMENEEYVLSIYQYEGYLVEELTDRNYEFDPAGAQKIGPVDSFEIISTDNGICHLKVDGQDVWAVMQSMKAGDLHG